MLVDSHCHLDFPELADKLDSVFALMHANQVERALCVSVTLEDFPRVRALAETYPHLHASVGVHPDYEGVAPVSVAELVSLAAHPRIVAIGETGLDYFRLKGDLEWQRQTTERPEKRSALFRESLLRSCTSLFHPPQSCGTCR